MKESSSGGKKPSKKKSAQAPFRVLFVEDEPVIGKLVDSLLVEAGAKSYLAANAVDAVKLTRQHTFDLILLDVVLASQGRTALDGMALLRMLRSYPECAKVPIYMVTAKTKRPDIEAALQSGATGYILKPFDTAAITNLVATLKAQRDAPPAPTPTTTPGEGEPSGS